MRKHLRLFRQTSILHLYFLHPFLYGTINIGTHSLQIIHHNGIGIPKHKNSLVLQKIGSDFVVLFSLWGEMLRAIKFNSYFSRRTIEIQDICTDSYLPMKLIRIFTKVLIPQLAFLLRHILSKLASIWG